MESFETTLTGSDGSIDGMVDQIVDPSFKETYQFTSLDDSLHLIIGKDFTGKWSRIAGTEPYFSGWVDELAEKIESFN